MTESFATVHTRAGALRGKRQGEVAAFLGIPYAAPPVGPLRWKARQPVSPWSGTRAALAFGPDCPQAANPKLRALRQDEDCLYRNVWAPTLAAGATLAVLFWIHGGGFTSG